MSHSNTSIDNNTCGRLEQPCYSFPYAQQIAEHGDTILLYRNYEFKNTLSIDIVEDLELTSYCAVDSCACNQTALINIDYSNDAYFWISSSNLKISRLHLKARSYSPLPTLFYLDSGIVNVQMQDSVVTSNVFDINLIMVPNSYKDRFETIEIHNVDFLYNDPSQQQPFFTKSKFSENPRKRLKDNCQSNNDPVFCNSTMSRSQRLKSDHSGNLSTVNITRSLFRDFGLHLSFESIQTNATNIYMYQNTFKDSLLSFDFSIKCFLNLISHRHYGSQMKITGDRQGMKSIMMIRNLTSISPLREGSNQLEISMNKMDGSVSLHNCTFCDSHFAAVSIKNVSKVSISDTIFRDIDVRNNTFLSTSSAVGLTLLSSHVVLVNSSFLGVSTLQNFPSSLYVQIRQDNHVMPLLSMTNLLFETSTFQNWDDELVWHLKVESAFLVRQNVTIRCLKGDQQFKRTEPEKDKTFYCSRCNTSSYNVLPPTMKWEEKKLINRI